MPLRIDSKVPSLDDYLLMTTKMQCRLCEIPLPRIIDHYDHQGGWPVRGFDKKQWLSIKCDKCGTQYSLWKLGVPR
jgi:hypothetical protein